MCRSCGENGQAVFYVTPVRIIHGLAPFCLFELSATSISLLKKLRIVVSLIAIHVWLICGHALIFICQIWTSSLLSAPLPAKALPSLQSLKIPQSCQPNRPIVVIVSLRRSRTSAKSLSCPFRVPIAVTRTLR